MDDWSSPEFERCRLALEPLGPLKTWSLIVTVFGDLAPDGQRALDSGFLGALVSVFGVKPEALRVALHRLRKDGWLRAEKRGRRSVYRLTDEGQASTSAVYERIYRAPCAEAEAWQICLSAPQSDLPEGAVALSEQLAVMAGPRAGFGFAAEARDVPDWMKAQLAATVEAEEFALFARAAQPLLESAAELSEEQALCLRILVLHSWRRLLLRRADAPERLLGRSWAGYGAREAATQLFARYGRGAAGGAEQG